MMLAVVACADNATYSHYESVAEEGWDKEDTLRFSVDTLRQSADYSIILNLRATEAYPYKTVVLMVDETVLPSGAHRGFPVTVAMATENGERNGEGVTFKNIETKVTTQRLNKGDSLSFKVYHKMRRIELPGITDVGIRLRKQ